jgi:RNA polymerase sigma factor (sigma-70 family)
MRSKCEELPITEIEERFNIVIERYGEFLRCTISRICPRDLGIHFDDIEQEARLRLLRALRCQREITNLKSYIYRITVTTTIDVVRQVKARREDQLHLTEEAGENQLLISPAISPDELPDRIVERRQVMRRIEAAMARLPEDRRRAVGLYLEGLSTQEIADLLEWSEPKTRNLVYRGLKDLRRQLQVKNHKDTEETKNLNLSLCPLW